MGPEGDQGGVELAEGHGAEDGPLDGTPVALQELRDSEENGQRENQPRVGHGHVHRHPHVRVARQRRAPLWLVGLCRWRWLTWPMIVVVVIGLVVGSSVGPAVLPFPLPTFGRSCRHLGRCAISSSWIFACDLQGTRTKRPKQEQTSESPSASVCFMWWLCGMGSRLFAFVNRLGFIQKLLLGLK